MKTFIRIFFFIALINLVVHAQRIPDDLDLSTQWGLDKINVTKAWDITTGSPDVLIAVFDTGIPLENGSLSHYDLDDQNKFILGNDYTDTSLRDINGHGTHVTGIIGAEVNNSTDGDPNIAGVVWNCRLLIFKMSNGNFYVDEFEQAVIDAVAIASNLDCKLVINITSASLSDDDDDWKDGLDWASSHNALVVASVGNRSGYVEYPAVYSSSYNNVIAVSATKNNDEFASLYSNHGSQVNVAAPGGAEVELSDDNIENIYSTLPEYLNLIDPPNYGYDGGTSMAAPHVAGVAGLILSINSNLTPVQVRTILEVTADDINNNGFDNYYGHGRINAYEALKYTLENYGGTLSGTLNLQKT